MRRVFVMGMMHSSPELVLGWATLQFFSARTTVKEFNILLRERNSPGKSGSQAVRVKTDIQLILSQNGQ